MMMVVLLAGFGLAALCALAWTLAVYTTPAFAGVLIARAAFESGVGYFGAALVGLGAGGLTYGAFQLIMIRVRTPLMRGAAALAFAMPAALAGYHLVHGLARNAVPSEIWQQIFAVAGGLIAGGTALMRLIGGMPVLASSVPRRWGRATPESDHRHEPIEILPPPPLKVLPPPKARGTDPR